MSKPQIPQRQRGNSLEWTPEMNARLELLWRAGLTATAIARDMGLTKNSIVGRAHRSKACEPRPTPIKAAGSGKRPQRNKRANGRQPGTGRIRGPTLTLDVPKRERGTAHQALPSTLPNVAPPAPIALGVVRACCWPMWADGERPYVPRYCNAPSEPARSYCEAHCAQAYRPMSNVSHNDGTVRGLSP